METKNKKDGKRGSFFLEDNGTQIGEMQYMFAGPRKMVIIHTEVNEAYKGRGLGRWLVKANVDNARERDKKISPLCIFAKKILEETPEYADVLY